MGEDEIHGGDDPTEIVLNRDLEQQISSAIDPRFLLQLVGNVVTQVAADSMHFTVKIRYSLFSL